MRGILTTSDCLVGIYHLVLYYTYKWYIGPFISDRQLRMALTYVVALGSFASKENQPCSGASFCHVKLSEART